jgi:hypothetical protein
MLGVANVWMSATQSTGAKIEDAARDVILRQVKSPLTYSSCVLMTPQLAVLLPTVFVTASAATKLANKEGLPRLLQMAGWVLLGMPAIIAHSLYLRILQA